MGLDELAVFQKKLREQLSSIEDNKVQLMAAVEAASVLQRVDPGYSDETFSSSSASASDTDDSVGPPQVDENTQKKNALLAMCTKVARLGIVYVRIGSGNDAEAHLFNGPNGYSQPRYPVLVLQPQKQARVETDEVLRGLLDEDISSMNLDDLVLLQTKLREELNSIQDEKVQILANILAARRIGP